VITTSDLFENINDDDELWLADIETMTMNLGQELSAWRESRQRALTDDGYGAGGMVVPPEERMATEEEMATDDPIRASRSDRTHQDRPASSIHAATMYPVGMGEPRTAGRQPRTDERTRGLIDHGRRSARPPRRHRRRMVAVAVIAVALIAATLVVLVFRKSASWPASVATVQSEISTACQNPDVASEPDQVNFACAKSTSQILWVFSLMTSGDNPSFADAKSGRQGLEPIAPGMGGEVAWSLNLHHPYNPLNPIDSLEVAARAINNIAGGAAITSGNGKLTVQPGLESNPTNCARYTGSPAVIARAGFPDICAQPITSGTGQAALVSDIYGQWLVGSPPAAAQEASVLFENANNPGNAMVQAILRTLPAANG
jgi:hypothetical protein